MAPQLNGSSAVIDSALGHRVGLWNPSMYAAATSQTPLTALAQGLPAVGLYRGPDLTHARPSSMRPLVTSRLGLAPLPPAAAALLPSDRAAAARLLAAEIHPDWPQADLLDVLGIHARLNEAGSVWGIWTLVELATATVIGSVGFHGAPDARREVEIGFDVVADRRRRGYCTEGTTALIDWARARHGITTVRARCDLANLASARSLERLGFARVGQPDSFVHWCLD